MRQRHLTKENIPDDVMKLMEKLDCAIYLVDPSDSVIDEKSERGLIFGPSDGFGYCIELSPSEQHDNLDIVGSSLDRQGLSGER